MVWFVARFQLEKPRCPSLDGANRGRVRGAVGGVDGKDIASRHVQVK